MKEGEAIITIEQWNILCTIFMDRMVQFFFSAYLLK